VVSGNSIGKARNGGDGASVSLSGKKVTAVGGNLPPGVIYIEEPDRASGIRVEGAPGGIAVGDTVSVSGTLGTTAGGERKIDATSITNVAGAPLGTVGANNKTIKDFMMVGMYVRAWGAVTPGASGTFTLDDGSGPIKCIGAVPAGPYANINAVVSYDNGFVLIVVP